jgi:AmiR/NasT family two-component response regulator
MPEEHTAPIRVAVIADDSRAAGEIARALHDSGYPVRPFVLTSRSAYDRVRDLRPSVVLLRTSPRSFPLASAFARASTEGGLAVVVLTPTGSRQSIKLALDTGALIHLIEPVPSQALVAAIRVATARASDLDQLKSQLRRAKESVHARTAIERAKAILIRRFGLTENEAHRRLQQESRNRNRKLIDTAWHVIRADVTLAARDRSHASHHESPAAH